MKDPFTITLHRCDGQVQSRCISIILHLKALFAIHRHCSIGARFQSFIQILWVFILTDFKNAHTYWKGVLTLCEIGIDIRSDVINNFNATFTFIDSKHHFTFVVQVRIVDSHRKVKNVKEQFYLCFQCERTLRDEKRTAYRWHRALKLCSDITSAFDLSLMESMASDDNIHT